MYTLFTLSIGLTPPLASAPRVALRGPVTRLKRCANVETETRQRQDFRDRAKARQTEKHHYITQARFTVGPTWSLSLGRRIYAVVCWFHSSGLQLLAACVAFTVAGPKVWNVLPEGTSAQSLKIFWSTSKNLAFQIVIHADTI